MSERDAGVPTADTVVVRPAELLAAVHELALALVDRDLAIGALERELRDAYITIRALLPDAGEEKGDAR